jgi:hypothetical protein
MGGGSRHRRGGGDNSNQIVDLLTIVDNYLEVHIQFNFQLYKQILWFGMYNLVTIMHRDLDFDKKVALEKRRLKLV